MVTSLSGGFSCSGSLLSTIGFGSVLLLLLVLSGGQSSCLVFPGSLLLLPFPSLGMVLQHSTLAKTAAASSVLVR
jgi:hypothetical protein